MTTLAGCLTIEPGPGRRGLRPGWGETMGPLREAPLGGRRPTMRDVAERARVSFKTVSRVVNEEGGVSPALERRVRQAIEELDFRPNVGARILRRSDRRTASIGLLLEDVVNPFSAAVLRAVEDAATPRGVVVYSASLDEDPARERDAGQAVLRAARRRAAAGPGRRRPVLPGAELRAGTAIVCVDREAHNLAGGLGADHQHARRRGGGAAPGRGRAPADRASSVTGGASSPRGSGSTATGPRSTAAGSGARPGAGRARPARRRTPRTVRSPGCSAGPTRRPRCSPRRTW